MKSHLSMEEIISNEKSENMFFFRKNGKKILLLVKNKYFVALKCNIYVFLLLGGSRCTIKVPIKGPNSNRSWNMIKKFKAIQRKKCKNYKSLGRDLKNICLPNKKYISVVSGGSCNFMNGGLIDFWKFPF